MKTFTLLALSSLLLFSCQKEAKYVNVTPPPVVTDTSALGKFITATGITDANLKTNLDSLISRAKQHGWWDLCKFIYPFAGGTQASCKFNLKDPQDADASFRLLFNGGTWTFTPAAANPGAAGYGYTYFNPSTQIADPNSCHLSVYSMDDVPGGADNADIGAYDDTTHLAYYMSTRDAYPDSSGKPFGNISKDVVQGTTQNGAGFFLLTKTASYNIDFYSGSSLIGSDTLASSGNLPNRNLFICNQNFNGAPEPYDKGFSQRGLAFVTIGSAINNAMEGVMYADIANFVENK